MNSFKVSETGTNGGCTVQADSFKVDFGALIFFNQPPKKTAEEIEKETRRLFGAQIIEPINPVKSFAPGTWLNVTNLGDVDAP